MGRTDDAMYVQVQAPSIILTLCMSKGYRAFVSSIWPLVVKGGVVENRLEMTIGRGNNFEAPSTAVRSRDHPDCNSPYLWGNYSTPKTLIALLAVIVITNIDVFGTKMIARLCPFYWCYSRVSPSSTFCPRLRSCPCLN